MERHPKSISILPTDREFADSPDAGDKHCLCSRCGEVIGEGQTPIRAWPHPAPMEYRFHPECLGIGSKDIDPEDYFDAPVEFKPSITWKWAL